VTNEKIVRLLEIPEGRGLNWKAAAKAVEKADDDEIAMAFDSFEHVLADPEAYGVRCFPHRGTTLYLFIADSRDSGEDDPTWWVDQLWESCVLDALGLEMLATAVD
jgi:hypothetical protein